MPQARQSVVDGKKACTQCKEWKLLEEFSKDKRCTSGKTPKCKSCLYSGNLNRYHTKPGFKENAKKLRDKSTLKNRYGLTKEDVDNYLEQQNYSCAICKIPFDLSVSRAYHIDHSHVTGKVRSLLCALCNVGLGSFKDSIENLSSAISYLKEHS